MRFFRPAIIAAALAAATTPSVAEKLGPFCGKGDKDIPGHYTMSGVMEVGSELIMRRDGSFEFYLAYGANDQYGKGCWTQHGKNIALFPQGKRTIASNHTPDTRGFTGILLTKEGRDLVWSIPGSHMKGRYSK